MIWMTDWYSMGAVVVIVCFSLVVVGVAVTWWRKRYAINPLALLALCGGAVLFGLSIFFLQTDSEPCTWTGPPSGTEVITSSISSYGAGPSRHMIVLNLTEIGGPQYIHDDDKRHATMTTYVHGTKNTTYDIGVEIKGSTGCCSFKLGLGIETWEPDGDSWDDKDTLIREFGFRREYEDYVIRREGNDPAMVLDDALLGAQPDYYDYTLVEVLYAVGDELTYEGLHYFVNNPAKKDSIPGSSKFKATYPPSEPTYIVEWEYDTSSSCKLPGQSHVECKYPTPSKIEGTAGHQWLANLLTFNDSSQLDFTSLADEFVMQQAMLGNGMAKRSMLYHVLGGQLKGGPLWDAETGHSRDFTPLLDRTSQWVIFDDAYHLDWWKIWLTTYPAFSAAVRNSTALATYRASYMRSDARIRAAVAAGHWDREQARWSCGGLTHKELLDTQLAWHDKRYSWMQKHIGGFTEKEVTYVQTGYWYIVLLAIGVGALTLALILQVVHTQRTRRRPPLYEEMSTPSASTPHKSVPWLW